MILCQILLNKLKIHKIRIKQLIHLINKINMIQNNQNSLSLNKKFKMIYSLFRQIEIKKL
jgi:hypothetical protein